MDITQKDRDSLRVAQQKLAPSFVIGNIVEHKIQDPVRYKTLSRQEQGLAPNVVPELAKIVYKSVYFSQVSTESEQVCGNFNAKSSVAADTSIKCPPVSEINGTDDNELPIKSGDLQSNLWLNIDKVEFDKLEWMSERAENAFQEKLKSCTHFDQDGKVIAPGTKPLDDGSQQTHDIQSLVRYLDSTYQPQITYSLNVIAKIAARATVGNYDAVFDNNIHQILIEECLLRVRRHIDSSSETICLSALKCLKALVCNTQVDEIFLDKMFPLQYEEHDETRWLSCEQGDFDIDMKDIDCVRSDAILALVERTDVLTRFNYLLKTKVNPKTQMAYQDCILDIITRVARHSRGVCWLLSHSGLLSILIQSFLPSGIVNENQHMQSAALRTIKFLRIISLAAQELKHLQIDSQDPYIKIPETLVPVLQAYYHIDCYNAGLKNNDLIFRLHIETLRLMKSLTFLPKFKGYIYDTFALDQSHLVGMLKALMKLKSTKIITSPSSLDWQYAAAIIDLMGHLMAYENQTTKCSSISLCWSSFIKPALMQWLHDIIQDSIIPHQDVSIAIAATVDRFSQCSINRDIDDLHSMLLENIDNIKNPQSNTSLILFKKLLREAANRSQLDTFSKCSGKIRDPVMLHSFGFMNFNFSPRVEHSINSVASIDTPFILLRLFINVLLRNEARSKYIIKDYIDNPDLARYLRPITTYHKSPTDFETNFQNSMLAQFELQIVVESILLSANFYIEPFMEDSFPLTQGEPEPTRIKNSRGQCYSQLLFYTLSVIGLVNPRIEYMSDLKDRLLEKVILNRELHTRMSQDTYKVSLPENEDISDDKRICKLNDDRAVDLDQTTDTDLLTLKTIFLNCEQPGRYWLFQPLIEYYEGQIKDEAKTSSKTLDKKWFVNNINHHKNPHPLRSNCTDEEIICGILRLNALLMQNSSAYLKMMIMPNVEEYLCLIGLVFLDDELFLNPEISKALSQNLKLLLPTCAEDQKIFKDASKLISTLNLTLADYFNRLVEQYEGTSYGDRAFSNFLILFLATNSDKYFRRILFSEKVQTCLSLVRLGQDEIWVPEELLLAKKETDQEIRNLIRLSSPYLTESSFLDKYRKYHSS